MKSAELTSKSPTAAREQALVSAEKSSVVLAFPGMERTFGTGIVHRFTTRDRIVALDWAGSAQCLGFTRLVFEAAEDVGDGETGEFLLIYAAGAAWARWGIACGSRGLTLWHSARGTTIGVFDTMAAALGRVQALGPA